VRSWAASDTLASGHAQLTDFPAHRIACPSLGAACQGGGMEKLSNQEILDARLNDWRKLAQALHTRYRIKDFNAGSAFVAAIAEAAEVANHHLDLKMTCGAVDISLCTHEDGSWVTQTDVDLARKISELAREKGLETEPTAVTQLEIALDTAQVNGVAPFWSVLLTGSLDNTVYDSVFDPTSRVPSLWFQDTDEHETPHQRWHFDLWLAPEVAEERIKAAVEIGGSVVDNSEAPSYTVLADPDGNKVCVCTCLGRS